MVILRQKYGTFFARERLALFPATISILDKWGTSWTTRIDGDYRWLVCDEESGYDERFYRPTAA